MYSDFFGARHGRLVKRLEKGLSYENPRQVKWFT